MCRREKDHCRVDTAERIRMRPPPAFFRCLARHPCGREASGRQQGAEEDKILDGRDDHGRVGLDPQGLGQSRGLGRVDAQRDVPLVEQADYRRVPERAVLQPPAAVRASDIATA